MSWTNHLNSRSSRMARIDYRWRQRRRWRRAAECRTAGQRAAASEPVSVPVAHQCDGAGREQASGRSVEDVTGQA